MSPTAWPQQFSVQGAANVNIPTTTETVVCTLNGVTTQGPGAVVTLEAWLQVTVGTATTALVYRIRRASLTGTLVGVQTSEAIYSAAGATEDHSLQENDSPGELAGGTYVLTVQQTAATGNGTAVASSLVATCTGA